MRQLKRDPDTREIPIIMLTARVAEDDRVAGLDGGADDYITKPIKPRVFVSRLKALLRRKHGIELTKDNTSGLIIDRDRYTVTVEGEEINLPKKEFELLDLLMSKPGNIFTREVILDTVWGSDIVVGDRTIDVHIRKLREKIGGHYIKTVKGVGYKLAM